MPVDLSPAMAPPIKIQIGCNIRHLPQFVNVLFPDCLFPDKRRQGRRVVSLTNGGHYGQTIAKLPQD